MNRLAFFAFLISFAATACHATCDSSLTPSYTTNIGLQVPQTNSCSWGTALNENFSILDSSVAILSNTNNFTGANNFSTNPLSLNYQSLRFYDSSLGRYLSLIASGTVTTTSFVLPNADGTSGQVLSTDGLGRLYFQTAGASGNASSLAVNQNGTQISSPTVAINFLSPPFSVSAVTTSTAQVTLLGSSVTLQGNTFNQASRLVLLDGSSKLPAVDGSQLTGLSFTGVLAGGATSYWNNPSTATFYDSQGVNVSTVVAGTVTISGLSAGQCVQTGAGGLLGTSGTACGGPPSGSSSQVQYNNSGVFAGTSLETIGASSVTFNTVSSATYTGFSSMTMTGMYFDGSTSTMTFSSGTINNFYAGTSATIYGALDVNMPSLDAGIANAGRLQFDPSQAPALILIHENITATSSNQIQFWNAGSGEHAYIEAGGNGSNHSFDIAKSSCNPNGTTCAPTVRWTASQNAGTQTFKDHSGNTMVTVSPSGTTIFGYTVHGSSTTGGLAGTIPSAVNQMWYCSDCANALTCISTGTAKGAFSSMQATGRTTGCL